MCGRACLCARALVYRSIESAEAFAVGETLCFHGDEWPERVQVSPFRSLPLWTDLLIMGFIDYGFRILLENHRSRGSTAELKMFADPRRESEREKEREREGGGRERERCAPHYPWCFRARANFTHLLSTDLSRLFPRFTSLFLHFPKRRIFTDKLFFGHKIAAVIDITVLTTLAGRCKLHQL